MLKVSFKQFRYFFTGLLLGAAAILPGVSAGVLSVALGIYQLVMEFLANPLRNLPRDIRWILPIGIGWVLGFWLFAKGVIAALDFSETAAVCFFVGLIFGMIPSIFQRAGKHGRSKKAYMVMVLCGLAVTGLLLLGSQRVHVVDHMDFFWYAICGIIMGISVVVPGISFTSFLMALGLYRLLMQDLVDLDPQLFWIAPFTLGTILLLSRAANWLFSHYDSLAWHGILGAVIFSSVRVIPRSYHSAGEVVMSLICCAAGIALAWFLGRLSAKYGKEEPDEIEEGDMFDEIADDEEEAFPL